MKRIVLAAALAIIAVPAIASEGMMCSGEGVETHFPVGGGVGFALLDGSTITIDGLVAYANDPAAGGIAISASEAFSGNHRIEIDFADPNMEQVLAEVRLFWTEEESDPVFGGTLNIPGRGAWAISCSWG